MEKFYEGKYSEEGNGIVLDGRCRKGFRGGRSWVEI